MDFVVYSKKGCSYCDKIKVILSDLSIRKGYPVICYELGTDFSKEEFLKEFGENAGFPQVVFGGKSIGGCSDTVKYMMENGLF